MYDVHVIFDATPGELARFGQLLGCNGVGLEGGFNVRSVRKPLIRKLQQARPGELGEIAAALAAHCVSVLTQYSDHANHLILLTDNDKLAAEITRPWAVNA